jgi:hypothetical protein
METQEAAGGTQHVGGNVVAMSEENIARAEKVWSEGARGWADLEVESASNHDQSNAKWCQDPLGKVLDATAKTIKICTQSK